MDQIKRRYEGWALYLITRGTTHDILSLAKDIYHISILDQHEIITFFQSLRPQVNISIEIAFTFDQSIQYLFNSTLPSETTTISETDPPTTYNQQLQVPLPEPQEENGLAETQMDHTEATISEVMHPGVGDSQDMYEITEYLYCSRFDVPRAEAEPVDYSGIPEIPLRTIIPCQCGPRIRCSSAIACACSRFLSQSIGIQRGLLIVNGKKYLPREWKDHYYLAECTPECSCDKLSCYLTFFDGISEFQSYQDLCVIKGMYRASRKFRRGEFIMEVSGALCGFSSNKMVKITEGLYLDVNKSNLSRVYKKDKGNCIPVRVVSWVDGKCIGRLGLFAGCVIKAGEEISLDFSRIEGS